MINIDKQYKVKSSLFVLQPTSGEAPSQRSGSNRNLAHGELPRFMWPISRNSILSSTINKHKKDEEDDAVSLR